MEERRSLCSNPNCPMENVSDFEEKVICGEGVTETVMVCGVCEAETSLDEWQKLKNFHHRRQRKLKEPEVSVDEAHLDGLSITDAARADIPTSSQMSRDYSTDSIKDILSSAPCKKCGSATSLVEEANSRQESLIWYCNSCEDLTGVDDSLTMDDMLKNMAIVAESLEKATLKTTLCPGGCSNDDPNKFVFEYDDNRRLVLRCAKCSYAQMIADEGDVSAEDDPEQMEDLPQIQCDCSNTIPELFAVHYNMIGQPEKIKCHVCEAEMLLDLSQFSGESETDPTISDDHHTYEPPKGRTEIKHIDELREADHITWHQKLAYWHHAIVSKVGELSAKVKVIHYNGPEKQYGGKGIIQEEWLDINVHKEALYRCDYGECNSPDEVLKLARSRLGETKYGLFSNNCEHFAQWCKTGIARSGQVESFYETCKSIKAKITTYATKDGTKQAIRIAKNLVKSYNATTGEACATKPGTFTLNNPQAPTQVLKRATSGMAKEETKCAASSLGKLDYAAMGLVVGIEAYRTGKSIHDMHKKKQSGDISHDEFVRFTVKRTSQGIGGASGSIAGGIIGQMVIPIPVVGSLAGATLGSFLGEGIGTYLGRKAVQMKDGR